MKLSFYMFILILLSCSFAQKIKDSEMAFEMKQYAVAIDFVANEYPKAKSDLQKGRKAWIAGQSNIKLLEYNEAESWLQKSVDHGYGPDAIMALARIQKINEKYQAAIESFKKLTDNPALRQEAEREILMCKQAESYKAMMPEYRVERILENSSVADYGPSLYENQFLVFTSERKDATGSDIYKWTGERFSDLYIMQKSGTGEVRKFDSAINTTDNEGTPWFSRDMQVLYFTRCVNSGSGDDYCKLMISRRTDGIWEEPEELPFIKDKINYGQPTLIENDSVLVFSADIEQPGGTRDLYYAVLSPDGSWSVPEKLPATINSMGNEKFPTGDKDTLYFSSDHWPGMGGFDIFKTYLRKDGTWTIPFNLGSPINSGGDDFSFIVDYNAKFGANIKQQGYFSSSRSGSGKDDIFKFYKLDLPKEKTDTLEKTKNLFLTVMTRKNMFNIQDDPNSGIKSKAPLGQCLIKITDENGTKIKDGYSDNNGFFYCEIPIGKKLTILGAKLEYLNATLEIQTNNIRFAEKEFSKTINTELILDKIYTDREINLENIYYDYDKWDIRPEAKPTLDQLAKILNDNPQIEIQLSSHTDCRGEELYNTELSQKRAQAAIDYLIAEDIDSRRLIAKGFGETQPVVACPCDQCTDAQHQTNRRTTFKVLK